MTQNVRTNILGRNKTRLELWYEVLQRPNCGTGQIFEVRGESISRLTIGSRLDVKLVLNGLWPRGLRHGAKRCGTLCAKEFGLTWMRGCSARFAHCIHSLECPKEVWSSVSWSNSGPAAEPKQ